MTDRLAVIKDLRAKGATIRMIDDVAAHLEANGGYDSPVFVATVEFIIKIRQIIQVVVQQQAQKETPKAEVGEKEVQETEKVNFEAAKEGVKNDEDIEALERSHIVEYINDFQQQRESFVELMQNPLNEKPDNKKNKKQKNRPNSLLEKLFKVNSQLQGEKDRQKQQAQTEAVNDVSARQNAARQAQQQAQNAQRGSLLKMNLLKMKLLSTLKMSKDYTVVGKASWEARKSDRQMNKNAQNAQGEKSNEGRDKVAVETKISENIDRTVKAKQQETKPEIKTEKGKFEKLHGEKAGPRADDKKVAEMAMKDAVKLLQQSGVKTAPPDAKMKKEMDAQIQQVQQANGGGATPKMQR